MQHKPQTKYNVLIVEDQKDFQILICRAFDKTDCHVSVTSNGAEALKFLCNNDLPDLIILDLKMPVMDGFEFRKQQLSSESLKDIPVFLYSSHGDIATIAKCLNCDGFLHKNSNIKQLTEEVFKIMAKEALS